MFGVGDYVCMLKSRGGGDVVAILDETNLSFGRKLNDVSAASVEAKSVSGIDAWSHELSIYRDQIEVWVGPLQQPQWETDMMSLVASDLMQWFERRTLSVNISWLNTDAAQIFSAVIDLALAADPTPNITLGVSDTGVLADRTVKATDRVRAGDILRELSRTAIDFTAIGRHVWAGGTEIPGTTPFTLVDGDLLSPKVVSKGSDAVTGASVLGTTSTVPIVADVGGVDALYGLVQQTYSESDIKDFNSAQAAAAARTLHGNPPPVYVSGILSSNAGCEMAQLIPGTRVTVHLDEIGRPVHQVMRLAQIDCSVQDGGEACELTLVPLGEV